MYQPETYGIVLSFMIIQDVLGWMFVLFLSGLGAVAVAPLFS